MALFVPLQTARSLLGETEGSGTFWVSTSTSGDTALVDRTATALEDRLSAAGYVRRIFTTEGLVLAVGGWVLGIPLGYLLTRMLVRLVWEVANVRLPFVFPAAHLLVALVGTVVLALVVLYLPVRRAVGLRPGDALRYG